MYLTYFIQVVFIKSIAKREEKEGVVFSSYGVPLETNCVIEHLAIMKTKYFRF